MISFFRYTVIVVAICSSAITAEEVIDSGPKACPCYTATSWITDNGCPAFEPTKPCIVPMCVMLSTVTVPGTNSRCLKTPTVSSFLPCQTACRTGCETFTTTSTHSSSCVPKSTATKPTITLPPVTSQRSCYTKTVLATGKCPEDDLGCTPPDCIWLSTTTVPGGPVKGCRKTKTVTASRACKGTCDGACATQWVTETAVASRGRVTGG